MKILKRMRRFFAFTAVLSAILACESPIARNNPYDPDNTMAQVAKPVFSPKGGSFTEAQTVTIVCNTTGAAIRYTTDKTDPSSSSTLYSAPLSILVTTTIKAVATKSGSTASEIVTAEYVINYPSQRINVKQGSTNILSGTGSHSLGEAPMGTSGTPVTFTIENLGTAALGLTGSKASLTAGDVTQFGLTPPSASSIAVGESAAFTVAFTPTTTGAKSATVSITSDDAARSPYTFTVTGTGTVPVPIIAVKQGTTDVPLGTGSYDFGSVLAGTSAAPAAFTIGNNGSADLALSGTVRVAVTGTDAAAFTVAAQPSATINPGGSAAVSITFSPQTAGAKTATVTIESNDAARNPYTFTLTGTGIIPAINVIQGAADIATGTGTYAFAGTKVNTSSASVTFTIENTGTSTLNLSGTPRVLVTGGNSQFSVTSQPAASVAAGGSVTFTMVFAPTSEGSKSASVSISNDDPAKNPYTFTVTGSGTLPQIAVLVSGSGVANGGSCSFGNVVTNTSAPTVFAISNTGAAALELTGSRVALSGTNASEFTLTPPVDTSVDVGSEAEFTVTFQPTSTGSKTATVTVTSDASNLPTYAFTITGTGVVPVLELRQGSTVIANSGVYDFLSVGVESDLAKVFTIYNTGTSALHVTNASLAGTDAAEFSLTQPSATIAAGEISTFTVTFSPASAGGKVATMTIASDDQTTPSLFFSIFGTGVTGGATVNITLSLPGGQTISFSGQSVTLAYGSSMTVTATPSDPATYYEWYCDSTSVFSGAAQTSMTYGATLMPGSHSFTVIVTIGGYYYSETIWFTVTTG